MKHNKGFTLVELMVAIAIGTFMLGVMGKVLFDMKKTSVTQTNIQKIQNDINFSMEKINRDLRASGFRGCVSTYDTSLSWVNFVDASASSGYSTSMIQIQGSYGSGGFSPGLDSSLTPLNPSNNFDVLTIRETVGEPLILNTDMTNTSSPMVVSGGANTALAVSDLAIISSCSATSLFKVATVNTTQITATSGSGIGNAFAAGSQIYNYKTIVYYVANDGTKNNLYRQYGNNTPELVITNIDKFKVLYGLDTDGDTNVDKYSFANNVSNFKQVVSVKVGIVIKGDDRNTIGTDKASYSYNFFGTSYTPNDSIVRKVIYINSSLRNKLP